MMRVFLFPAIVFLLTVFSSCQHEEVNHTSIEKASFVLPDNRPFEQAHASTLVSLGNDEFLVAWFGGTKEKHNDVGIWLTKGDGDSWSFPKEVAKIREVPHWNPVLFRRDNGEIILFFKVGSEIASWETWYIKSTDNGESWSAPLELVAGDRGGRGPVRNKPIVLSNGYWVAGASDESGVWRAFVDISKDEGKTWEKTDFLPFDVDSLGGEGMIQPTLWESEKGKVHMLLRTSGGSIYRSDSDDYGATWNKPYATNLPNPNSGIDLVKLEDGTLALLYNPDDKNWGSRAALNLAISTDNGEKWIDVVKLEEGKEGDEYSYPAIVSSEEGVALTYTWNRSNIAFKKIKINDKVKLD
ncbi:sialidase family protein [Sphingobacterium sp. SYP-B4668]|uniref:sialidase family protein n=1 Tax=Sphingobacterium sp. SYP-B4668 TaxID=2996035 RepID=UPI0022DE0994|nr:sialidase family protein [Sphingobacterium sp. SYP-B4668]